MSICQVLLVLLYRIPAQTELPTLPVTRPLLLILLKLVAVLAT